MLVLSTVHILQSGRSKLGGVAKGWFALASFGLLACCLLALATPAPHPWEFHITSGLVAQSAGHFPPILFVAPLVPFACGAIAWRSRA